jgi:hypothetical protein
MQLDDSITCDTPSDYQRQLQQTAQKREADYMAKLHP